METFRSDMECPPEEADNESEIILQVRGVSPSTNAFTVQMYFENSRRSGGGEIKKIEIKDGIFYIEFKDEQGTFLLFFNRLYVCLFGFRFSVMRFAVIQRKHVDGTMNKRNATVKSSVKQTIILLLDIIISMNVF